MANTDAQWAAMTKLVQQMMQRGDAGNIFAKPQQNNETNMVVLSNLVSSFSLQNNRTFSCTSRLEIAWYVNSETCCWTLILALMYLLYFSKNPILTPLRRPLGLYDYPQIIKKPMDLGTVKKKIADGKYKSITNAADDVRLVWTNCMTYNADGSDFYNLAKNLNKKWEEKYAK